MGFILLSLYLADDVRACSLVEKAGLLFDGVASCDSLRSEERLLRAIAYLHYNKPKEFFETIRP